MTSNGERVAFYGPQQPNFQLANFYPAPIRLDGHVWPTVEHYYQAQKSAEPAWQEQVRHAPTPAEAKRLGWATPDYDDNNWEGIKEEVMRRAIRAKFSQYGELRDYLLSTGDATIVEKTPDDEYWGVVNGRGRNRMGVLLMELRDELRRV